MRPGYAQTLLDYCTFFLLCITDNCRSLRPCLWTSPKVCSLVFLNAFRTQHRECQMTKPKLYHAVVELEEVEDSNLVKGSGSFEICYGRRGIDGPSVSLLSLSGFLSRRFLFIALFTNDVHLFRWTSIVHDPNMHDGHHTRSSTDCITPNKRHRCPVTTYNCERWGWKCKESELEKEQGFHVRILWSTVH